MDFPTSNNSDYVPAGFPAAVMYKNEWWWAIGEGDKRNTLILEKHKNGTARIEVCEDDLQEYI